MTANSKPVARVGDFEIHRVIEMQLPFLKLHEMFPGADADDIAAVLPRLQPWAVDAETRLLVCVQSYLVKTPRELILLDTCIGCDKTNERFPDWAGRRDETWLENLLATGFALEDVTHVLCSHLHTDHAGWNTRLIDGRWVPTFPSARYIFSAKEVRYSEGAEPDLYRESVLPVIEAGQADLVDSDHQICNGIWLEPTPGHTPGHVAIHLESGGEHAVMWGDLLHSPAQCVHPHWSYRRDWDATQSTVSRHNVLGACAEQGHMVLSSHFPSPSIGRIRAEGDGYWFTYDDGGDG